MTTRNPFFDRRRALALVAVAALLVPAPSLARAKKGLVRGIVTDLEESPVAGAEVSIFPSGDDSAPTTASTGDDGRFELTLKIEEDDGPFTLRADAEGFQRFEAEVDLVPGEGTEVGLKMLPLELVRRQAAIDAYNAGAQAFRSGDLGTAQKHWEEALAEDPTLPEAQFGLAEIHFRAGRTEQALQMVRGYLEARPDDENAHRLAFEAYRKLGDEEGMERELAYLEGTGASDAVARDVYNAGVAAYREGDTEEALEQFRRAMELDPELLEAGAAAASVLYEQRLFAEAVAEAEGVLEKDPGHLASLKIRFVALEAMEDERVDAALDAYATADPEAVTALLMEWAEKEFKADQLESAERHLGEVLEIDADHAAANYQIGLVYAALGDNAAAVKHLRRFAELAPDDPEADTARAMADDLEG